MFTSSAGSTGEERGSKTDWKEVIRKKKQKGKEKESLMDKAATIWEGSWTGEKKRGADLGTVGGDC